MRAPEIQLHMNFGKDIIKYLSKFNIKKAIEIGSGSGNGSTQSFLKYFDSFESNDKELHCFEPVESWFQDLEKNINQRSYCTLYNCSAISYSDLLVKNFDDDFYNTPYNKLKNQYDKNTLKTWYEQDLPYFKESEYSILPTIEADAVLIDGCEFSGYSEFKQLHPAIRLIFLDDCIKAFKTNQVYLELLKDKNWELIFVNDERNGYAIFGKKL
jgi:hypothetical protein